MSTIASLALRLGVDTKELAGGLKASTKTVESWASSLGSKASGLLGNLGAVFGVGIPLSAAAAGAAIVAMASAGIERIDQLGDAAQRLGVTTEALSTLRYAADLTGSSSTDLDAALSKMNANLGDAATKATPAGDALARMGLDAKQLVQLSPDAAFKKIVDGFGSITNPAERAAAAMDVFGKGGIAILNTLGAGSGELERLAKEAEALGVSIDQVDHAKVATAKDQIDRAWAAFDGLGNSLAINLAPAIGAVADLFTEWFGSFGPGKDLIATAMRSVVKAVAWVQDGLWTLELAWKTTLSAIVRGASKAAGIFGGLGLNLSEAADLLDAEIQAKLEAGTPGDKLVSKYDAWTGSIERAAEAQAKLARESAKAGKAILGGSADDKKYFDDLGKWAEDLEKNTRTPLEKYRSEIAKIGEALALGLIDQKTAERAGGKAKQDAGFDNPRFAGAESLGSREAYSSILRATSGRSQGMTALEVNANKQLVEAQLQTRLLGTIAAAANRAPQTIQL